MSNYPDHDKEKAYFEEIRRYYAQQKSLRDICNYGARDCGNCTAYGTYSDCEKNREISQ